MKILFTATYYAPYISGLTIYTQRLAEELAKRKYRVDVLTSQHDKSLKQKEVINNVNVIRVPVLFRISKGFIMPKYVKYAIESVQKADVVIIGLPQFEGFIVALIALALKKPIYTIYYCDIKLPFSLLNIFIEKLLYVANLITLIVSKAVITYSKDFAGSSSLLKMFSRKLNFIYPPIIDYSYSHKAKIKLQKKLPKTDYIIGIIGRVAAEKGIEYFLKAIPLLKQELDKDFHIVIAGPKNPAGEEKYWEKINPYLKEYDKFITFLGTLATDEMGAFYSLLDVLVLPSINSTEAFGMVQVEAMFYGVPVIASDLPGVRVPIKVTDMGELARPKDSPDLATKIAKVLHNKNNYVQSKKAIKKYFFLKSTIDEYEKIFTSLS